MQHIGLLFNTAVHVVMYYYFYLCGVGGRPGWKKFVTLFQLVQFVASFAALLPNLYLHFLDDRTATLGGCKGQHALIFNAIFNSTLLLEFASIFARPTTTRRTTQGTEEANKQAIVSQESPEPAAKKQTKSKKDL